MAIERELKFRLAPRAAARAARLLKLGAPQSLRSVYYDTPEERLRSARLALRVRRAGRSWIQTLKSEISPLARGEWEALVAQGNLELARLPLGEIKQAIGFDLQSLAERLEPRFTTRFVRRSTNVDFDGALIEAALDCGQIIAGRRREPIRELELELKRGAPHLLARYAKSLVEPLELALSLESKAERGYRLAHGEALAPPRKWRPADLAASEKPGQALARLIGAALEQVTANALGVLTSEDAEYLHQMRVGFRRLRATLTAFKALAPRAKQLKRVLREFSPVLGRARDWDVFVATLPKQSALERRARAHQARARRAARTLVGAPRFSRFLVRILQWIEQAPWQESGEALPTFAAHALEHLHRDSLDTGADIEWSDARRRHALRIRMKRLRYACDAFAPCFSHDAVAPYVSALEALQDDFGELNDIAVGRSLLRELGGDAATARALAARERRLIARAPRDWEIFAARSPFWRSAG
jgi:inorganic triphosphatase YgiF